MQFTAKLAQDFMYSVDVHKFPVDLEIATEVPVEICSRVNVAGALLTRVDGSDTTFGYGKSVLPAKQQFVGMLPTEPIRMRIDVFEHDDDFEDYLAGHYRCDVKVLVWTKVGEDIIPMELRASLDIDVD